ncbi:hypothetical protein DSCA_35740 [Desulfosarcina alkanivorans]|uniref:Uncharacterized protein n=1 Tax=Desulfosarcina alkanivorans TaxID=571177 RepID=A0A5K7YTN8_9BACT|nr:hypothetical protein [Desulfosarcina alkanivorans]BBO69644.1 hypothetical protein DSCA_35740 [Desulfosarcina alkanivorans]
MITFSFSNNYSWVYYIISAGVIAILIRLINSFWRTFESEDKPKDRCKKFKDAFLGRGWIETRQFIDKARIKKENVKIANDYWYPFFLGWLELVSYPILLHSDKATYIGAWLAFKTVHKWGYSPGINR